MNEMEVEKALDALTETAGSDAPFLRKFPIRLLAAYQTSPSQIARLIKDNETRNNKAATPSLLGPDISSIEFFWPKQMHYRAAAPGRVQDVVDQLAAHQKPKAVPGKTGPRFIVSTDGEAFAAIDLKTGDRFKGETLGDLVEEYDFLQPMFGVERYTPPTEQEADVKAARHMREIHDAIVAHDDAWAQSEHAEALNTFMIRLLFCLFADGAGVFPPKHSSEKPFARIMNWHASAKDGTNTRDALEKAFCVLDWPENDPRRQNMEPRYRDLPYANGKLFEERLSIPVFNGRAQRALRRAIELDWGEINADIFGSMIQAIAGEGDRSHFGMHYTSVPNIMKVLGPLFINSLKDQLSAAGNDRRKLETLIERISKIHIFDPACGSGNFLIIAYRELRAIETDALATLYAAKQQLIISSKMRLDHFHGIDPVDFACRTARLSLWVSQIQADRKLAEIGINPPAILPLHDTGDIHQGSALDIDWSKIAPTSFGETFIVGNPPYIGSKTLVESQKSDMSKVFSGVLKTHNNLDYVTAWIALASRHISQHGSKAAFVSTNSVCQGEQVPTLWPYIHSLGVDIEFAHTSFKWTNLAANNAGVSCVILGLCPRTKNNQKTLFTELVTPGYPKREISRIVPNINPYLAAGDNIIVSKTMKPINGLPVMQLGNIAFDGGNLLLDETERKTEIAADPRIEKYIHPIAASRELIRGIPRYCLWIEDSDLEEALTITSIERRIRAVRAGRVASPASSIRELAKNSHKFGQIQFEHPESLIAVPTVFSESRPYMTVSFFNGFLTHGAFGISGADPWTLSVLSSSIHLLWAKTISGRLAERIRYTNTLTYNTFPMPIMDVKAKNILNDIALRIIEVRQPYIDEGRTLAWLYDYKSMPRSLRVLHQELDEELESMYIGRQFKDDAERLEHLFRLYSKMRGKIK